MTINEGLFIFSELIFQPLIFDNSDYYENRMSAVLVGNDERIENESGFILMEMIE
ncbi:MAG: hypothetical protein MZV64_38120 [Ignavibacteriales bacterium]|nr:hypothetical protein [Ignavibacteriales bacterium]